MNGDDIRRLLSAAPFEKFFLTMTDGAVYEVAEPEQLTVSDYGPTATHHAKGRRTLLSIAHVVSIGFPPAGGDPFFLRGR